MADPLNVVIVGHDNQTKCEVANALYRERNKFKQFSCHKLNYFCVNKFSVHATKPFIVTTPCLATPLWQKEFKRLVDTNEFPNKCFVYVKDMSSVRVNDLKSIRAIQSKIKCKGNDPTIVAIPYHPQKRQQAEKERQRFNDENLVAILLNLTLSLEEMKTFSKEVFSSIKMLKPQTPLHKSMSDDLQVGATGIEQQFTKSLTEKTENYSEEMVSLLESVTVDDASYDKIVERSIEGSCRVTRPSTPIDSVDLDGNHWMLYRRTLSEGKAYSYHTRVNVVGYHEAGKTTLVRRLQKMSLDLKHDSLPSTECLEINKTSSRCIETDKGRLWETHEDGYEKDLNFQRMAASLSSTNDLTGLLRNEGRHPNGSEDKELRETKNGQSKPNLNDRLASADSVSSRDILCSSEVIEDEIEEMSSSDSQDLYNGNQVKKIYLSKVIAKVLRSPGMRRYISYWDFAGQSTYYTTHQAFMAPAAVYLLVVDLSKPLDHELTDSMEFRTQTYQKTTVLDAVRFWAGSIKSFASDENGIIAPIIVVGTRGDIVHDSQKIDSIFEEIKEIIGESELPCIAIDNTKSLQSDERLLELRDRILDKALGIFEKQVRAHWIDLEYMLIRKKQEEKVLLSFEELEKINKGLDEPLPKEELYSFLEHEHCNGFLMHFNADGLKNIIILQPFIMVNFINLLLRKARRQSFRGWNSDGTFDQVFLDDSTRHDELLSTHRDILLSLLIHLKIVFPKEITEQSSTYFMPCLLGERPEQIPEFGDSDGCQKSPLLRISFDKKLIPPAFFHSLVVSMMFALEIDCTPTQKGGNLAHVFYHYCRFKLTETGSALLEMSWSNNQIFLQFINLSTRKKLQDLNCLQHLQTIRKKVTDILKTYRHNNVVGSLHVKCPKHDSFLLFDDLNHSKEARCVAEQVHMVTAESVFYDWINIDVENSKSSGQVSADLQMDVRSRQMKEREMALLSGKIGAEFKRLFIFMGLENSVVQHALQDNNESVDAIFQLFISWGKLLGEDATIGKFLSCLRDVGLNESLFLDVFR